MSGRRVLLVVVLVLVLGGLMIRSSYNRFAAQDEGVKSQRSQVENQLQRRNDLIPKWVETTKGFAQQEQSVFKDVADARAKMAGMQKTSDKIQAANAESSAL